MKLFLILFLWTMPIQQLSKQCFWLNSLLTICQCTHHLPMYSSFANVLIICQFNVLTICQCTHQNSVLKYEQANINVKNVHLIYFFLFMCGMKYMCWVNSKSTIKLIEKIIKKTLYLLYLTHNHSVVFIFT